MQEFNEGLDEAEKIRSAYRVHKQKLINGLVQSQKAQAQGTGLSPMSVGASNAGADKGNMMSPIGEK